MFALAQVSSKFSDWNSYMPAWLVCRCAMLSEFGLIPLWDSVLVSISAHLANPTFSPRPNFPQKRNHILISNLFHIPDSQNPRIPGLMLLTNGLWELIDPLSGLSSLFPVFWCFEEQLAISSCEYFLVVVFVQITLFEQSWPCPFVHFFAGLLTCDCFLVLLLLFISPCLNSPGLAEQLESEAEEGGEAREPNTKTNLGIWDFYKWKIAWKIW